MSFLCGLLAAGLAVPPPPSFFAGPAKVGDSVTYRVSRTMDATQAPDVSTIVVTWKAPAKLYARLEGSTAAALAVARAADSQLSLAAPNPADPSAATIAMLLDQLNFPGRVAASLGGGDHAQMSMNITPPPPSTASPAPARSPAPVNVSLDVNLLSGTSAITLIAEGNSNQRGSPYGGGDRGGRGGRGGGMGGGWPGGSPGGSMGGGGWHSNRSGRDQAQSGGNAPSVDVAMQAIFDQSGALQHATYRERFTTQSRSGAQTVEHTIAIDRVDERRQENAVSP